MNGVITKIFYALNSTKLLYHFHCFLILSVYLYPSLSLNIQELGRFNVTIYDVLGRTVQKVLQNISLGPGNHTINIDSCIFNSNSTINNIGSDLYVFQGSILSININNSTFFNSEEPIVNEMGGGSTTINVSKSVFYNVDDIINLKNNSSTNATFTNCTFFTTIEPGGSGTGGSGDLTAINCIFYPYVDSVGYHMHDFFRGFSNYSVSYSLTYYDGDWNFEADPLFTNSFALSKKSSLTPIAAHLGKSFFNKTCSESGI